jgi:hypothetical protein
MSGEHRVLILLYTARRLALKFLMPARRPACNDNGVPDAL